MTLYDTHCHLDLFPDPGSLIQEIEQKGIYTIAVTNTPSVFPAMETLTKGCRYVRPALGLHPQLAVERRGELPLFLKYLPKTRYVGEVGLDHVTTDRKNRAHQRHVFDEILKACHGIRNKILTIHSRRSEGDVLDALGDNFPGTIILHWYSGSLRNAERAVDRGYYFSINPAMARGQRFASIMTCIPPSKVLLESDGPFVTAKRQPASPLDMVSVVKSIAQQWNVSDEKATLQLSQNFEHVLKHGVKTA